MKKLSLLLVVFFVLATSAFSQIVVSSNVDWTCTQYGATTGTISITGDTGTTPTFMSTRIETVGYGGGVQPPIYPYEILRKTISTVQSIRPVKLGLWYYMPQSGSYNQYGIQLNGGVRNNIPGPDTNLNAGYQPTLLTPGSGWNQAEIILGTNGGATWNEAVFSFFGTSASMVLMYRVYIGGVWAVMPSGAIIQISTGTGNMNVPNPPTTGFYPLGGATNVPIPVCFNWQTLTGTIDRLQISLTANFASVLFDQEVASSSLPICIGSPTLQANTTYYWRVARRYTGQSTFGGWFHTATSTGIVTTGETPKTFKLEQNYPNPFNPATSIKFAIPKQEFVTLKIYDITGKEVKTLVNEAKSAGNYLLDFNGSDMTSGTYFYKLQAGEFMEVKKMILIK
jgi:hypothetical protein